MAVKTWIARLLLAFVFVTVGFALGRHTSTSSGPEHAGGSGTAADPAQPAGPADKVVVYSAHMTFRCWECNQIEAMTEELLDKEFGEQKASGKIEYRIVDYMKDTAFARRYNIATSTVVVARFEDGELADFDRLDKVWTLSRNRDKFMAYVREAILSQIGQLGQEVRS